MKNPYDGQVFPSYVYDANVLFIARAEYNEKSEYLYLPCERFAIEKAIARLGAPDADSVNITLDGFTADNPKWMRRLREMTANESIYDVNELVEAIGNVDKFTVSGGVGLAQNLIELAGGENIFADTDKQFLNVGAEEIISRNPDVIVIHAYTYLGDEDAQGKIDCLMNAAELSEVTAIKNNNIVIVPLFQVNPSIQNVNYVESLAAAMYPELFE